MQDNLHIVHSRSHEADWLGETCLVLFSATHLSNCSRITGSMRLINSRAFSIKLDRCLQSAEVGIDRGRLICPLCLDRFLYLARERVPVCPAFDDVELRAACAVV